MGRTRVHLRTRNGICCPGNRFTCARGPSVNTEYLAAATAAIGAAAGTIVALGAYLRSRRKLEQAFARPRQQSASDASKQTSQRPASEMVVDLDMLLVAGQWMNMAAAASR